MRVPASDMKSHTSKCNHKSCKMIGENTLKLNFSDYIATKKKMKEISPNFLCLKKIYFRLSISSSFIKKKPWISKSIFVHNTNNLCC